MFSSRLSRQQWWFIGAATAVIGYLSLFRIYQYRTADFVNFTPATFDLDLTHKTPSPIWNFSNTPILLVSAFFPLPTSKHSDEEYAAWLQLFLSRITTPLVIYTTVAFSPTISRLRGNLPIIINTDFSTPFDVPPMKGLQTKYADQHARLDPEKFRHNPSLYATWNAKAWLVEDAARRYVKGNKTEWFFWSDAGSVRQSHTFEHWPDLSRIENLWEKGSRESGTPMTDLLFMQIWDPPPPTKRWRLWEKKEDGTVDLGTSGMMSEGSFFGGKLPAIKWWASTFYELHDYYLSRDIFVGKDQNLFNTIMLLHPSRILTVWPRDPRKRLDPPPSLRNGFNPQPTGPPEGQYVPIRKCTWASWYYFWYWLAGDHERREMRQLMTLYGPLFTSPSHTHPPPPLANVQMTASWQTFREDWRLDAAQLIALFLHLPLWGIYTLVFWITCYVAYKRRLQLGPPVIVIVILYLLCAINTIGSLQHAYRAFILSGNASAYFLTSQNGRALNTVTYCLETAIADSLMLWRLYIIWSKDIWVMILPSTLWIMSIITGGIACIIDLADIHNPNGHNAVDTLFDIMTEVSFVVTVAINILVTGLIVWRIRQVNKQVRIVQGEEVERSSYTKIILLLVESGSLYTASQLVYLIAFTSRSTTADTLIADLSPKIIGLAPTLILLQINLGYLQSSDKANTMNPTYIETVRFANPAASVGVSSRISGFSLQPHHKSATERRHPVDVVLEQTDLDYEMGNQSELSKVASVSSPDSRRQDLEKETV
ncbi:hypothetical protein FRB96_005263 [Tulasnella sp. 330]|nr:hypothetical protein FRB96_005263 [Tulasnella sp. 330]KAG8882481.1 hypothetical protein FRB98_003678 [Tulasnella sp. 332]